MRLALVLIAIAACHDPAHPAMGDGPGSGGPDASACVGGALFASERAIAQTGDVLRLEGSFAATGDITFTPGVDQTITTLGADRATVAVPAEAASGSMALCGGGPAPLPFEHASFTLDVGRSARRYDQAAGGARGITLYDNRNGATAHVIGNTLYLVGGGTGNLETKLERAVINADGSLGVFSVPASPQLSFGRAQHTGTVIGNYFYVVGGTSGYAFFDSVDRAPINSDGTLGAFSILPATMLRAPRANHTAAVIGSYLYVFGGDGVAPGAANMILSSIERAPIAADGSLGTFETVASTLAVPRAGHATVVIGDYVYMLGGSDDTGTPLDTVERAPIAADGSLGAFAIVPGVNLPAHMAAFSTALIGHYIYVFGGLTNTPGAFTAIRRAKIHADGSFDTFATVSTTLAIPRYAFSTVLAGNYLYAVAGDDASTATNTCERLNVGRSATPGTFAPAAASLPSVRSGHASVVLGNHVYVIGGNDGSAATMEVDTALVHPDGTIDAFAAAPGSALAAPRAGFANAVAWSFYYVIGGRDASGVAQATLQRAQFDDAGVLGPFSAYTVATLGTARDGASATIIVDVMYVIGGRNTAGAALGDVERVTINPGGSLQPFSAATGVALATPRYGHASAVIGDHIYVLGGTDGSGSALASIEVATIYPDDTLSSFSTVTTNALVQPRAGATAAVIGDELYVFGGPDATIEHATIAADGSLGTFAVATAQLTAARAAASAVVVGNSIYVIGGGARSDIDRAPLQ